MRRSGLASAQRPIETFSTPKTVRFFLVGSEGGISTEEKYIKNQDKAFLLVKGRILCRMKSVCKVADADVIALLLGLGF